MKPGAVSFEPLQRFVLNSFPPEKATGGGEGGGGGSSPTGERDPAVGARWEQGDEALSPPPPPSSGLAAHVPAAHGDCPWGHMPGAGAAHFLTVVPGAGTGGLRVARQKGVSVAPPPSPPRGHVAVQSVTPGPGFRCRLRLRLARPKRPLPRPGAPTGTAATGRFLRNRAFTGAGARQHLRSPPAAAPRALRLYWGDWMQRVSPHRAPPPCLHRIRFGDLMG